MRSFMKVHLRGSSSSLDKDPPSPLQSEQEQLVYSSHSSPSKLANSAQQFVKKSSTSVSNFFNSGLSPNQVGKPNPIDAHSASAEQLTDSLPNSSLGFDNPLVSPAKKLRNPIKFPRRKTSSSSLSIVASTSPKIKSKSSFTSLNGTMGPVSNSRLKSYGGARPHSGERQPFQQVGEMYPYASFPPLPAAESPTTIYGTKTHNWGSEEPYNSNALHLSLSHSAEFSVPPPVPAKSVLSDLNAPPEINSRTTSSLDGSKSSSSIKNGGLSASRSDESEPTKATVRFLISSGGTKEKRYGMVANDDDDDDDDDDGDNDGDDDDDVNYENLSDQSDSSSQFSFQAWGRNTSIKYYKSKDQVKREQQEVKEKQSVDNFVQFINSGEPLEELDDDLNYVDFDARDDTDDLFNRKLFSDDEEDEMIVSKQAIDECEDRPTLQNEASRGQPSLLSFSSLERHSPSHEVASNEFDKPLPSLPHSTSRNLEISMLLQQLHLQSGSSKDLVESSSKADFQPLTTAKSTEDPPVSTPGQLFAARRVRSIKYHQLNSNFQEDNFDRINSKYSWLPSDEGANTSSLENSVLDEVNEIPEEYDYDNEYDSKEAVLSPEKVGEPTSGYFRHFDTSPLNLVRSASQGNKISLNEKTITLFGPIPPKEGGNPDSSGFKHSETQYGLNRPYYSDLLDSGGDHINRDHFPGSTEDELSFLSHEISAVNIGDTSFLTTISEASYEDSQSLTSTHR